MLVAWVGIQMGIFSRCVEAQF